MGERTVLSTLAGQLGRALCQLGSYEEASEWAQRAKQLGVREDTYTQALWRQVQATERAANGDSDTAIRLADEAVTVAASSDALDAHADALFDLADVLRQADQTEPSLAAAHAARTLYERKGNTVMAARVPSPTHAGVTG
jgi:tetratricopeptide (TPR) repeat protein